MKKACQKGISLINLILILVIFIILITIVMNLYIQDNNDLNKAIRDNENTKQNNIIKTQDGDIIVINE